MKTNNYILMSLSVMVLSACGSNSLQTSEKGGANVLDPAQKTCTMIAAAALGIEVKVPSGWNASTLTSELKIEVTDAKGPVEMPELSADGSSLRTAGAYENAGPLQLKVTLRTVSSSYNVIVKSDGCHVTQSNVVVEFQPPNKIVISAGASY